MSRPFRQELNHDVRVLSTEEIGGVEVNQVSCAGGRQALHFWCGDLHYDVRKHEGRDPVMGKVDIESSYELTERLVASLECP